MKVWGSTVVGGARHRTEIRVIVCASSQKRAVELLNASKLTGTVSLHHFRDYWAETGNVKELAIARQREGVWFAEPHGDYVQAWPK